MAFHRMLAGFAWLPTYRAQVCAAVVVAMAAPLSIVALVFVLAADRMTVTTAFVLLTLAVGVGTGLALWAIHRLLAPIDVAIETIDAFVDQRSLPKAEVTGSDEAAQLLRGVQSLVSRLKTQDERIRKLAERDELTGVYQRRAGRSLAQALIEGAPKRGRTVRLYYVDVDRFRAINELRGPGYGDVVLKAVGARLERAVGEDGVAIRWGGDEFVVLHVALPDALAAVADHVARPIVVKGFDLPVTVKIGRAETTSREPFESLVARAVAACGAPPPPEKFEPE
ncbi:MAG: GGDEF domain-containing protein [Betaproteobacteria bacterium]